MRWALPGTVHDAQGHAVDVDRLGGLERPDDEGHQVGGHRHGVGEVHLLLAVAERDGLHLGAVGDGGEVVVDDEGDGEDGLEVGLVPAREGPAGVGGLELGGGDDVLDAVVVGEGAAVEAPQLVVEDAGEREVQCGRPGRQRLSEGEGGPLHWSTCWRWPRTPISPSSDW